MSMASCWTSWAAFSSVSEKMFLAAVLFWAIHWVNSSGRLMLG